MTKTNETVTVKPKKSIKELFPEATERIVEAFTTEDGTTYYKFDDFNNIPCDRGFHALSFFNELDMRCTKEYLIATCTAVMNELNSEKKVDRVKIGEWIKHLQERAEWIVEPDCLYKLASVVYFDETEDPYKFEYKYAHEKMAKFKKFDIAAFFLSQPIVTLLPSINMSEDALRRYLADQMKVKKTQLDSLLSMLSSEDKKNGWFNTLELQKQEVSDLTM